MDRPMQAWLCGVGVGAATMFLLDPDRGRRRRAMLRDRAVRATHKTRDAVDATRRDLGNRLSGAAAELGAMLETETPDDERLRARVRSELGRVASHPRAISVDIHDGVVVLRGDALASEVDAIVDAVRSARGLRDVRNELTPHLSTNGVPSLQGESERPGQWMVWMRGGWSPTALLLATVGATAAVAAATSARRA